jgi:hypothetical protein
MPYSWRFFRFLAYIEGVFPAVDLQCSISCSPSFLHRERSPIRGLFACTGDDVPPLVSGIFLFQEHLILLVYYAPMPDSKNEDTIRSNEKWLKKISGVRSSRTFCGPVQLS